MAGSVARAIAWVMRPRGSGSVAFPGDPRPSRRCVAGSMGVGRARGCVVPKLHPPLPCVLHIRRRFSLAPDSRESSCLPQGSSKNAPPSTCPSESTHASNRSSSRGMTPPRAMLVPPSWFGDHLDGLLLRWGDGLVAAHRRPWGSPGCGPRRPTCLPSRGGVPTGAMPSRAFPSRGSRPRVTARLCPLVVAAAEAATDFEALLHRGVRRRITPFPA